MRKHTRSICVCMRLRCSIVSAQSEALKTANEGNKTRLFVSISLSLSLSLSLSPSPSVAARRSQLSVLNDVNDRLTATPLLLPLPRPHVHRLTEQKCTVYCTPLSPFLLPLPSSLSLPPPSPSLPCRRRRRSCDEIAMRAARVRPAGAAASEQDHARARMLRSALRTSGWCEWRPLPPSYLTHSFSFQRATE